MPLSPPILRDLTLWTADSQDLEYHEVWEISAPPKNSMVWSILLSNLIPAAEIGNFSKSLSLITGDEEEASAIMSKKGKKNKLDEEAIRKRLKNVNPFKNAHTLYNDENLTTLMQILKLRLNQLATKLQREGNGGIYDDILKLKAASNALQCRVDLFEDSEIKQLRSFSPKEWENAGEIPRVVIFRYSGRQQGFSYGFGLAKDYSVNLRRKALKHALRIAKVKQNLMPQILDLVHGEKFLIRLIQSSARDAIPTIYQSSYVLKKLNDIGLDVNPLSVDKGLSAFYHCFVLDNMDLLFVLYEHVINFIPSEGEKAKSDVEEVLTSLRKTRNTIENDFQKSCQFQSLIVEKYKAVAKYNQIMRFNKYQCAIMENIDQVNKDSSTERDEKINLIIISILSNYNDYYYFDQNNKTSSAAQFTDYKCYYDYHEQLDNFTCLTFFDYFLLLKTRTGSKQILLDTLKSLFRYLISKTIFHKNRYSNSSDYINDETIHFVPFKCRMKLKQNLTAVLNELSCSATEDVINSSSIVIGSLKEDSLIKEECQLSRLKLYLRTGIEVSFESNSIKTFLVLERALQVTGETLYRIDNDGIVTPLLKHCLPNGLEKEFRDIRNHILSHYHAIPAQGRQTLEQSELRFGVEMQSELKQILDMFESVFTLQTLRVKECMLEEFIQESVTFSDSLHQKLIEMKNKVHLTKRNFYRSHEDKYIFLAHNIIRNFSDNLLTDSRDKRKGHIQFGSFQFLLHFISDNCDSSNSNDIKSFCQELQTLIDTNRDNLSQEFGDKVRAIFEKLKCTLRSILIISKREPYDTDFSKLCQFYKDIKQHEFFSFEEKQDIRKSFTEFLEKSRNAKLQLIAHYENKITLKDTQIEDYLKIIFAPGKTKYQIKKAENSNKIINLQNIKDDGDRLLGPDEDFYKNFLTQLGDIRVKKIIPNLPLALPLHEKIRDLNNQKLDFVINRIKLLKEILINEDDHISKLRKFGTSPKCRDHTKRLMRQRYMEDMNTRAALETLLFDCLEIVNKKEDFKDLWQKTSSHFAGINLRDFLSHGCPIFETVNNLDQEDLPKEIIDTILALIEDLDAIHALAELWKTEKYSKSVNLEELISSESFPEQCSPLKDTIIKCSRWKSYLALLPM